MWPVSDLTSLPVSASQTLRALSSPPEATYLPSGLKATAQHLVGVAGVAAQLAAGLHVPDDDGAVLAGGDEALAVGAEGDGLDHVAVAQAAVAEDAGDVVGQAGGRAGQVPARLAEGVGGLDEPAGRQGVVALLGEGVGLLIPFGREFLGQALSVGVGAFGAVLRLQIPSRRRPSAATAAGRPSAPNQTRTAAPRAARVKRVSRRKTPSPSCSSACSPHGGRFTGSRLEYRRRIACSASGFRRRPAAGRPCEYVLVSLGCPFRKPCVSRPASTRHASAARMQAPPTRVSPTAFSLFGETRKAHSGLNSGSSSVSIPASCELTRRRPRATSQYGRPICNEPYRNSVTTAASDGVALQKKSSAGARAAAAKRWLKTVSQREERRAARRRPTRTAA